MSSKLDNQEKLKVSLCPPLCAVAHAHSHMNMYPHIYKHTERTKKTMASYSVMGTVTVWKEHSGNTLVMTA